MPKFKVPKSVSKRFKVSSGGKLLRRKSGQRHLANAKSTSNTRRGNKMVQVVGAWERKIKMLLGV